MRRGSGRLRAMVRSHEALAVPLLSLQEPIPATLPVHLIDPGLTITLSREDAIPLPFTPLSRYGVEKSCVQTSFGLNGRGVTPYGPPLGFPWVWCVNSGRPSAESSFPCPHHAERLL